MAGKQAALLVYDDDEHPLLETLRERAGKDGLAFEERTFKSLSADDAEPPAKGRHLVALLADAALAELLDVACAQSCSVGVLPYGQATRAAARFHLPSDEDEAIELAFHGEGVAIDLMQCNGHAVLGTVTIGEVPFLDRRGHAYQQAQPRLRDRLRISWTLLRSSFLNLWRLNPFALRASIGGKRKLSTAVTGVVVADAGADHALARVCEAPQSLRDGRAVALFVAPASIAVYVTFLLGLMFRHGLAGRLPAALSYGTSDEFSFEADREIAFRIDGVKRTAKAVKIEVLPAAVQVNVGEGFAEANADEHADEDRLELQHLPEKEIRVEMIRRRLPLFTHALDEDYEELFELLRDNTQVDSDYVTLMGLSVLIAAYGLFLDSAAVVIGAMVLAPLMGPIISLSMGLLRYDGKLVRAALFAIAFGLIAGLLVAAGLALALPLREVTAEMASRLEPTLLDLGVAVFSGMAGAYVHARESVLKSLPGVAIAVALAPPLVVAGIGIGWWDWHVFSGAALLLATNLIGILLAAAVTFLVMGYAPIRQAGAGLAVPIVALLVIAIPLTLSYLRITEVWRVGRDLSTEGFSVNGKQLRLENLDVRFVSDKALIRADLYADKPTNDADYSALSEAVSERLERPVELDLSVRVRR